MLAVVRERRPGGDGGHEGGGEPAGRLVIAGRSIPDCVASGCGVAALAAAPYCRQSPPLTYCERSVAAAAAWSRGEMAWEGLARIMWWVPSCSVGRAVTLDGSQACTPSAPTARAAAAAWAAAAVERAARLPGCGWLGE